MYQLYQFVFLLESIFSLLEEKIHNLLLYFSTIVIIGRCLASSIQLLRDSDMLVV